MDYRALIKVTDSKQKVTDSNGVEDITWEMVEKWNDYCEQNGYDDNRVYSMDEFDEIMGGQEPLQIAQRVYFGNFNPNYDWFWFNGYANLESSDYILEQPNKSNPQIIDWDVVMAEPEPEEEEYEDSENEYDDSLPQNSSQAEEEYDPNVD